MKRLAFALAAILLVAEVAHAFRTPSIRRSRTPEQPPATVRMPDDALPRPAAPGEPAKPDISVAPAPGEPKPAAAAPPPPAETPKPAVSVVPAPAPKPEVTAAPPVPPKPEVAPVSPRPEITAAPLKPEAAPASPKPEPVVTPPKPEVAATPPKPETSAAAPAAAKPEVAPPSAKEAPTAVAAAAPSAAIVKPAAPAPAPAPRVQPEKVIEAIFACLAPGLPNDWKKAWIVVTEPGAEGKERKFEAKFYYSDSLADDKGETLVPCNSREVAASVYALNELLPPEQRRWRGARLTIEIDGKFELKYDY